MRPRKPNSASALETGNAVMDIMRTIFRPDINNVLANYVNFTKWLCHNKPKSDHIRQYRCDYAHCLTEDFQSVGQVNYLGRIDTAMTVTWMRTIAVTPTSKYTGIITDFKKLSKFYIFIFWRLEI